MRFFRKPGDFFRNSEYDFSAPLKTNEKIPAEQPADTQKPGKYLCRAFPCLVDGDSQTTS
jgi:hypothetical protein